MNKLEYQQIYCTVCYYLVGAQQSHHLNSGLTKNHNTLSVLFLTPVQETIPTAQLCLWPTEKWCAWTRDASQPWSLTTDASLWKTPFAARMASTHGQSQPLPSFIQLQSTVVFSWLLHLSPVCKHLSGILVSQSCLSFLLLFSLLLVILTRINNVALCVPLFPHNSLSVRPWSQALRSPATDLSLLPLPRLCSAFVFSHNLQTGQHNTT